MIAASKAVRETAADIIQFAPIYDRATAKLVRSGDMDGHAIVKRLQQFEAALATAQDRVARREDVLEEAARVAESHLALSHDGYDLTGFYGENTRCRAIATTIRSLKGHQ